VGERRPSGEQPANNFADDWVQFGSKVGYGLDMFSENTGDKILILLTIPCAVLAWIPDLAHRGSAWRHQARIPFWA
jgi:hypothetical protein